MIMSGSGFPRAIVHRACLIFRKIPFQESCPFTPSQKSSSTGFNHASTFKSTLLVLGVMFWYLVSVRSLTVKSDATKILMYATVFPLPITFYKNPREDVLTIILLLQPLSKCY